MTKSSRGINLSVKFFFVISMLAMTMIGSSLTATAFGGPETLDSELRSLVKISLNSNEDLQYLFSLGLDVADHTESRATAFIHPAFIERLENKGMKVDVVLKDADSLFRAKNTQARGRYHSTDETRALFEDAVEAHPEICAIEVIGKSHENRDIFALRITRDPLQTNDRPSILIMGVHHSREWIACEVPISIMQRLVDGYYTDDHIKYLVDNREIWVVPIVNPDGYEYSRNNSKYWRKNRRKNDNGTYGVDPNRNYGYNWGNVGASSNPSSDTYHGPYAFSEPETQAIRDLGLRKGFTADLSYHSYGELILYPWSYGYDEAPDKELFIKVANRMSAKNNYRVKKSSSLYPSMGDTDDWMYGVTGSISFTPELARSFIPSTSQIDKICKVNVDAALELIDMAGEFHGTIHVPSLAGEINNFTDLATRLSEMRFATDKEHMMAAESLQSHCESLAVRFTKHGTKEDYEYLLDAATNEKPGIEMLMNEISALKTAGL